MMIQKAVIFEFTSYLFEPAKKRIVFNYKTEFEDKEPLFFTETIILPKVPDISSVSKGLVDKLLQSLHIMLGISYYKFYCPKKIKLPYQLSKEDADFWKTVYQKGLGEFFYNNKLDPKISPKFPFKKSAVATSCSLKKNEKCLVGIGGGKDSIVAAELLKENNSDVTAFFVQTNKKSELVENIIKTVGVKDLKIQRFLDWQVFQKHQYNGHIPISAIYAFLGMFAAVLYQYSYVIVGNEHSSNFGNIKYEGMEINHQWSKSFEFEALFQNYVKNFISLDVFYFSLLRPFYEIRIAKMFSKYKKYFPYFSSCNRNFSSTNKMSGGLWCNECPKCIFAFTMLSAFLNKKELLKTFGKNLYQDESLLPLFKDILGLGDMKPFDCVGTFEEAKTALFLAKDKFKDDFIMRQVDPRTGSWIYEKVFATTGETSVPEQFKFLGMESVLILGYGKEGKVTKQYLKKYYPKLKIGIADAKQGRDYLKKQIGFDIAVKTPGIKKELVTIPYTTATNIFFSKVKGRHTVIGVTGSKGKSTTSTLIYEILKAAGKRVKFLGNIGQPMLEALLRPIQKDTIFVLELSSYQLDDLKFSPDIAVLASLFPEHMDYHGSVENYYKAKKNIIKSANYFVYHKKSKESLAWLKDYKGTAIPFSKKSYQSNLLGKHNQDNIGAAVAVGRILKIPDDAMKKAIKNFKGLPHRLEFVGEFKGIKFYDDANAATPEATIMAIKSLANIGTMFLGGTDRGYNFTQLEKNIKKYKIKNMVLFPDSGKRMLTSTKGFNVLKTSDMKKAVEFAYKNTKKGQICLLSCASPSYSLWKNFEEKGEQFKFFVKKIGLKKRS